LPMLYWARCAFFFFSLLIGFALILCTEPVNINTADEHELAEN